MKNKLKIIFISFQLISITTLAQPVKMDTVYDLIDTAKVPVNDRMFIMGSEGDFYGYKLQCHCYPEQTDPVFTYHKSSKSAVITNSQFKQIKFIALTELIDIATRYGIDRKKNKVFYFIEPKGLLFTKHRVNLLEPRKPVMLN